MRCSAGANLRKQASRSVVGGMSILSSAEMHALEEAAASSVACERATQLPAELTSGQWALETGWGEHQPGNNCFGIKAFPGCLGVQSLRAVEVRNGQRVSVIEQFAVFPSVAACFAKHAELLTTARPYAPAWLRFLQTGDTETLIREIAPIYSTDPNYASQLLRIGAMPEVRAALAANRRVV